jgi:hypothetical protein
MPTGSSFPKTTRPSAEKQRPAPSEKATAKALDKKLDAFPDRIDVRDWMYRPSLSALPTQLINCHRIPKETILDQKKEGACTGFALAAVINYHLMQNGCCQPDAIATTGASPRMLYELARRYDEWPGEHYEGSSARGTIKGWAAHGVAVRTTWPDKLRGFKHFDKGKAKEALGIPAGAYYRVMHRNIRDMHAALFESGILYATMMVHPGWGEPKGKSGLYRYTADGQEHEYKLPIIARHDRATDGHAIAIVGYTKEGFIIQNSWGTSWGHNGFAVLPYEDWMLHSSDCWVVQLGVPIDMELWDQKSFADTAAGKQRASEAIPLEQIRPYVIDIGNNGYLSASGSYWTTPEDITRLFGAIGNTAATWNKKRIMLYLHGGLNSEKEVARRIISFKQVCLDNEIYPVHIMWETDFWSSLKGQVLDQFTDKDKAGSGWLEKMREGALEILDRTIELTVSKPGKLLWDEMKENARLAAKAGRAMDTVAKEALAAFQHGGNPKDWELHIVAHSAGSIFTAHIIDVLVRIGVPIKTVQFMAPAISIGLFREKLLKRIKDGSCPLPTMYILSDTGERDDDVGPYGKSLLYLVSNAFESRRYEPILGMERFVHRAKEGSKDSNKYVDKEIADLYQNNGSPWPHLVISGTGKFAEGPRPDLSRSDSHGGFDNDVYTMNSVLYRMLEKKPHRPFEVRDLQY